MPIRKPQCILKGTHACTYVLAGFIHTYIKILLTHYLLVPVLHQELEEEEGSLLVQVKGSWTQLHQHEHLFYVLYVYVCMNVWVCVTQRTPSNTNPKMFATSILGKPSL